MLRNSKEVWCRVKRENKAKRERILVLQKINSRRVWIT